MCLSVNMNTRFCFYLRLDFHINSMLNSNVNQMRSSIYDGMHFMRRAKGISMVLIKGTFFPSQFSIWFGFRIHNDDKIFALPKKSLQMAIKCILEIELEV